MVSGGHMPNHHLYKLFKSLNTSADHIVLFVLNSKQGQQNKFDFAPLP